MRIQRRLLAFVLLFPALVPAQGIDPFPGEQEKWLHVRSPHFELYTTHGEGTARDTLYRLEVIRAVFHEFLQLKERMPLEMTVFRFSNSGAYAGYRPEQMGKKRQIGGLYLQHPDRATILIGPQDDVEQARHVINHEFIHHLLHVTEESPPVWYNEGIADLLATLEIKGGKVVIGAPRVGRVLQLRQERLMPLEQLFAVDHGSRIYTSGEHTGLFYAQSWGLVHYLTLGQHQLPEDRVKLFLNLARQPAAYERPEVMPALVSDLLDLTYADLLERLGRYVVSGRYSGRTMPVPEVAAPKSYALRKPGQGEMHLRLAELAVRVNRSPLGRLALLYGVEREAGDPRLHEVLGSAAMRDQDEATAREFWQKAVAAGTTNPAVFHALAQIEARRWFRQFNPDFRMRPEHADALRALLQRSIEAAPNQSTAYEILAWVEGSALNPDLRNVNLVQRQFPTLKDRPRALLGLILLRVHRGEAQTALELLDQMDALKPDHWIAQCAERVRARLEKREPRRLPAPPESRNTLFRPPPIRIPE